MQLTIEFWHIISLFLGFIGFLLAMGNFFLLQINKRFDQQEQLRKSSDKQWDQKINHVEQKTTENMSRALEIEHEFLKHRGDMPLHYVRREDYVRNQTIIESKLDGLAVRLEHLNQHGN